MESDPDQSRALVDAELRKLLNLEAILASLESGLDDHSSPRLFSHEMFLYDVSQALHDYLRPSFDALHGHIAAFHSVSSSAFEAHGKT